MADRPSKFSGMFEQQQPEAAPARAVPQGRGEKTAAAVAAPAPLKSPTRAHGKRSHPDYKQYSVLLRKQTHKQATRALDDLDNGQDLSDLMEQLLAQWLKKQQNKTQ